MPQARFRGRGQCVVLVVAQSGARSDSVGGAPRTQTRYSSPGRHSVGTANALAHQPRFVLVLVSARSARPTFITIQGMAKQTDSDVGGARRTVQGLLAPIRAGAVFRADPNRTPWRQRGCSSSHSSPDETWGAAQAEGPCVGAGALEDDGWRSRTAREDAKYFQTFPSPAVFLYQGV